jgi:hypothetical protein
MTYFGRAESITDICRIEGPLPAHVKINCHLEPTRRKDSVPVLALRPDATLEQVQASTDSDPRQHNLSAGRLLALYFAPEPPAASGEANSQATASANESHSVRHRRQSDAAYEVHGDPNQQVSWPGDSALFPDCVWWNARLLE